METPTLLEHVPLTVLCNHNPFPAIQILL